MKNSLDELENQLKKQIERFNQRRKNTRNWKNCLFIAQVLCTSLTTFAVSVNIKFNDSFISIAAAGLSVLAMALGIFQSSFMFHERLHVYTLTSSQLQGVLSRLKMKRLNYADDSEKCPLTLDTVSSLHQDMETILANSNEQWSSMMKKNKPKALVDDLFKGTNSQQG